MEKLVTSSYKEFLSAVNLQRTRVCCVLGVFLFPLSLILDFFLYPEHISEFLILRIICSTVLLVVLGLSYTRRGSQYGLFWGMFIILFMSFILNMMIHRLGYETPYYAGLNLVILGIGVLFTWTFVETLFATLCVYFMYLIPILILNDIDNLKIFLNNNLFILETMVISISASYFTSKLRKKQFDAQQNLAQAKDNLSHAYAQLSELDKAKTQFFSNISHELRTPLTLILAPLEALLKQDPSFVNKEELKKKVEMCHGNALRLLKLINHLLDVVKANLGKMELKYSQKDLIALIKDVVIHLTPLAEKKKVTIQPLLNFSSLELFVDEEAIEKVLVNLIQNSIKFISTETGVIKIHCVDKGSVVEICVEDNGIGMPQEYLEKIFEPFFQIDAGSKRAHEGSGIGLGLCRQIVELHGGKICAQSEVEKGTKVFFTLPKKSKKEMAPVKRVDRPPDWSKEISRAASYEERECVGIKKETLSVAEKEGAHKNSVLIVEDNYEMRDYLASEFKNSFRVFSASNGKEGLNEALNRLPDLVISDVMMPEMDGYELCKSIKQNEKTKQIPVLLLTAKDELSMRLSGYGQGADDYMAKPFSMDELMAKAKALIHGRQLEREMELYRRLANIGEVAAGVAHELNNALNVSMVSHLHLKKLLSRLNESQDPKEFSKEFKEDMDLLSVGMQRAHYIVHNLLTFANKKSEGFQYQDVNTGIESTLQMLNSQFTDKKIKLHKYLCQNGEVYCDLNQLNQVFFNILKNACDAVKKEGEIWIRTWREEKSFLISIRDNGIGIEKEKLNRIFDPFFTTKPIGQGTGLGLSISYNIVKTHHGKIDCHSELGQGTEFKIQLSIEKN